MKDRVTGRVTEYRLDKDREQIAAVADQVTVLLSRLYLTKSHGEDEVYKY